MSKQKRSSSRVVEPPSAEKAALISAAAAAGFTVAGKQIDRYRNDRVLAPALTDGRGKSGGVGRPAAAGTGAQLIALCTALRRDRSLHRAAVRLWLDGYNVPLERIREALQVVAERFRRYGSLTTEAQATVAFETEGKVLDRRSTPKRTRRLARKGKLADVALVMMQSLKGGDEGPSAAQLSHFVGSFEQLASLDKAREGLPEVGIKPWLDGDSTEHLVKVLQTTVLFNTVTEATDEELLAARDDCRALEIIQALARPVQRRFGDEALGLSLLTRDFFGNDLSRSEPALLAAMLVLKKGAPTEVLSGIHKIATGIRDASAQNSPQVQDVTQ